MKIITSLFITLLLMLSNTIHSASYTIEKQSDGSHTLFHIEQKMLIDGSTYEIATPIAELPDGYTLMREQYYDVFARLAKKYQWKSAEAAACAAIFLVHAYLVTPWVKNKTLDTATKHPPHFIRWLWFSVDLLKSFYLALGAEALFGLCHCMHELWQGPGIKITQQEKHI